MATSSSAPSHPLKDANVVRLPSKAWKALSDLGLHQIDDLLAYRPRRHEDRSHFDRFPDEPTDQPICLSGTLTNITSRFGKGKYRRILTVTLSSDQDDILAQTLTLRWFNMTYLQKALAVGMRMVIYGRVALSQKKLVVDHPEFEIIDEEMSVTSPHMGRLVPVYPLTSGISQKQLRGLIHTVIENLAPETPSGCIPEDECQHLISYAAAVRQWHFPDDRSSWERAHRRLALDHFTKLHLEIRAQRNALLLAGGLAPHSRAPQPETPLLDAFIAQLPYRPTAAQQRAITVFLQDQHRGIPMARLLQGDVGAGKTLVAAAAVLITLEKGQDAVLMAPTQLLAEQHYDTFLRWFEPLGISVTLKTGRRHSMSKLPLFDQDDASQPVGTLHIGTHALIHDTSAFENGLGIAVIDEQHKFGVAQRQALLDRGDTPHLLVMTATPIPRTLTLTRYGDLDVTLLDELPPGRGKIVTGIRSTTQTNDAALFIQKQLASGRQAYIVYPLIDESETKSLAAATVEWEQWNTRLPGYSVGLLHGRMNQDEKRVAMQQFASGATHVLVSTTVVEVGVDVPNANLMLVYHAERFGLAQLHQLRGRVGRGCHTSYCILMIPPDDVSARARLRILEETCDGFRIAEEDLRQRGPGELMGEQQSGQSGIPFVEYYHQADFIEEASQFAARILPGPTPPPPPPDT